MSLTTREFPIVNTASALPAPTAATPLHYRAFIDGLRALAVLAVLFYHADLGCTGGYVGVDVFFVISGYLITGIIFRDIDVGQFQILKFWERRVLRILPALVVIVIACLAAGWILFLPIDFFNLGKSVVAQVLLAPNIYYWQESGYFARDAALQPLLHTWSLGIEEQFYLLLPGLLVAFNRFARKYLLPAILLLCGISFLLSVYWSYTQISANFYLLPTRAWELGIGSVLAVIPARRLEKRWLAEMLSWSGLLAIMIAVFFYTSSTRFPGATALLPCIGAWFVIWANGGSLTSAGKLLALRPVVFVGLISYSLYLWHWPILVFSKYWAIDPLPASLRMLLLIVSVVLAIVTWKFVETPFRKRRVLKTRPQIFAFAGVTTLVLLLSGVSIYQLQGVPARIPAAAIEYMNGSTDRAFLNDLKLRDAVTGNFVELGTGDSNQPIVFMMWGDSHAMAAMPAVDSLCKKYAVRGVAATHASTAPLVGYESTGVASLGKESIAFNNAVLRFIRDKRVANVVLVANWSGYVGQDKNSTRLHRGFIDTITALQDTGASIWIMHEVPQQRCKNAPAALAAAVMFHRGNPDELGVPLAEHQKNRKKLKPIFDELTMRYPRVTVLDPTPVFVTAKNVCRMAKHGRSLYFDCTHLTVAGAMELRPLFTPLFE
ncbi:MAG: acyltransferase family protein [Armatimonadota bacterium]